jgi:hypothetical protein
MFLALPAPNNLTRRVESAVSVVFLLCGLKMSQALPSSVADGAVHVLLRHHAHRVHVVNVWEGVEPPSRRCRMSTKYEVQHRH